MRLDWFDKLKLLWAWNVLKKKWKELKKMSNEENKHWYLSKGVIGGLVTVLLVVIRAAGIEIEGGDTIKDLLVENILLIITGAAGLLAVYGRITAKKKLTK